MKQWNFQSKERQCRIAAGSLFASGREIDSNRLVEFLSAVIHPGDRVCLEGNNQKQADVLARALADADPQVLHDLHMVQSGVVLPEHLDLFEKGIAKKLDFSYSGPQTARMARMLFSGKIELGAIHTYLELFARYFVDLTPQVALIAAVSADLDGNLYTGPKTGFPAIYRCALPALLEGELLRPGDPEAARVHALISLIAEVDDTNLLYRGGGDALRFARDQASRFLSRGGVGAPDWRAHAIAMHQAFVARRLSPGGCADLLAMTLFVRQMG
jgi:hypothetical protein